jgi:hypothetical protein
MLLRAITNIFSRSQRDAGTKKALGTIIAAPILHEVLLHPVVQAAAQDLGGQLGETVLSPDVVKVAAWTALLLGVARAAQPAEKPAQ